MWAAGRRPDWQDLRALGAGLATAGRASPRLPHGALLNHPTAVAGPPAGCGLLELSLWMPMHFPSQSNGIVLDRCTVEKIRSIRIDHHIILLPCTMISRFYLIHSTSVHSLPSTELVLAMCGSTSYIPGKYNAKKAAEGGAESCSDFALSTLGDATHDYLPPPEHHL
ncbi:uncharacterized protein ACOB8E_001467 isoform 1-T1 [Sarcophilus harrisii]